MKADSFLKRAAVVALGVVAFFAPGAAQAAKSSKDYVQSGLIAHWDGYENAGFLQHDGASTTWKDLTGRHSDMVFPNGTHIDGNSYDMKNGTNDGAYGYVSDVSDIATALNTDYACTVEIVCDFRSKVNDGTLFDCFETDSSKRILWLRSYSGGCICSAEYNASAYYNEPMNIDSSAFNAIRTYTAKCGDAYCRFYKNGTSLNKNLTNKKLTGVDASLAAVSIGRRANASGASGAVVDAKIYAIRIYDRELSDAEIAANAAVDTARFVNGECMKGGILVQSEPDGVGEVVPAYGTVYPAAGATTTFRAPVAWTNADENVRADCLGWTLTQTNGTVTSGSASEKVIAYTPDMVGATLTWRWDVEYKATATADAGATVSVSERWVKAGERFTTVATVTDPATQAFSRWLDGSDNVVSRDATLNVTITEPMSFTAKLGGARYVGSGATDYPSVAEAYQGARDYDTIFIRAGTYAMTNACTITNAVTVRSVSGKPADVILTMPKDQAGYRHFIMNNAEAALVGLTLTNAYQSLSSRQHGGSVLIKSLGGRVSHCVFANNLIPARAGLGGAIYLGSENALVTHCYFTGNRSALDDTGNGGNAIGMGGGTVRNCFFIGNGKRDFAPGQCGTIYATGGTIENCTFVNNADKYCAGVSLGGNATVRNCVFYGADCPRASSELGKIMYTTSYSGRFFNCCAPVQINDNGTCIASTAPFVDAEHGDWNPAGVIVDKGAKSDWMTDATDYAGNPRVSGSAPDIGCYERDQSQFGASVEPSATSGIGPLEVTFTVTAYGDVSQGVTCYWDWDGNGVWDDTSTGTTKHTYEVGTYAPNVKVVNNAKSTETYEPDYPFALTVVPKTIYVAEKSSDPVSPYGDLAHAAQTVADAFAVAKDGCEIVISNGTYSFVSALDVETGIKFRSWTGNPADVILTMPKDKAGYRHFILNHAGAFLSGLTLTNAYQSLSGRDHGGSVIIRSLGGSISNCVFANNSVPARAGLGGAVYIGSDNSIVTHCVFTGNRSALDDTGNGGNAIGMGGGIVRNCLFVGNGKRDFAPGKCGTVYISGGTIENCTFAKNADKYCAGISVGNANATIRNCVFYGEDCESPQTKLGKIVYGETNKARFFNCCASELINDNGTCIESADPFVDSAHGDWNPAATLVDKGVESAWMTGATDLAGSKRISGDYPDIGCYEKDQSKFGASVEASATSGISPCVITYTVTTYGDVSKGVTCHWDWDGDGKWDDETDGSISHEYETGTYATKVKVVNNANPSETYEPDEPFTLSITPKTIYVDDDSAEPISPYGDPCHAARTVADAFAIAKDGCEIVISNGTYSFASALVVETGVKFRSWTGNPADVILTMPNSAGYRHFILNHANASLSGLTLTNAYQNIASGESGGSVLIRAFGGSISNCVFANNAMVARHGKGGAVYLGSADALVTHCSFAGNRIDMNDDNGGNALGMDAGAVRNCLFVGNGKRDFTPGVCGTVYMTGGTLENCTFANNADGKCAGVSVGSANATIRNCVFYGEDCASPSTLLGKIVYNESNTGRFFNCCASELINDNGTCIANANPFVDGAHGDWNPAGVIVDKGVGIAWMEDATDFAGNARVSGTAPDIGCYEKDQSKFSASVEPSATSGIGPLEVTFTVTAYGEISEGITCYWDWDGDGEWDAETDGTTSHTYQVGAYSTKVKVVNKAKPSEIYEPESAFALTVVPKTIYVAAQSSEPVSPYGDMGHAATTVADAFAVAKDGCEIVISNGTYSFSSMLDVETGIRFRSWTGNPADVILAMPKDEAGYRHFILNHADASLSGLTLTNAYYSLVGRDHGGSVAILAFGGTISNCVFNGNSIPAWEGRGGAVSMGSASALVTHCTFMRNRVANTGTNSGGTTIEIGNGIVRNCLFAGNGDSAYGSGFCGTIYATGGTIESCTFVTNADKYCAGVSVAGANVAVRNCIFYGADCPGAGSDELKKIVKDTSYANKFDHCCAPVSVGSNCVVTDDPKFRSPARNDWRIRSGSPAVEAGLYQPWMDGATDLGGRPRIFKKVPDIGCHECQAGGFTVIVR